MKHLFKMLVIVVLLTSKAFAQADPVRAELDHIFQYIDKSQVPSGYLDEYGPQFAEKKWYTGVLADSNFIQFISGFRLLYNDIEQARIYSGAPVLTSLDLVNNSISQLPASNNTPLIFLISKYATANEDAINLNLFSNNGNNQVLDVAGRTQSPYMQNNFFAACPVLEDAPQKNIISLSYNPALVYSNCGKTISSVAVDFLKGSGYQTIAPNAEVSYTYTDSSGYKKFAIMVNCTDGSVYYCYSQQFVIVTTVNNNVNARYATLTEVELANPAITIPAVAGEHFGAKVYIRYSTKRQGTALANKLVKPFIVVEGYDLNDVAPIIDKENYTINSLIDEWDDIKDYDLNKELDETAGYDLVFVQYFTMDYIENNSKMLEKAIDQLNALKVNNEVGIREKNVVMGISLGGVLCRYSLAKMTKNRGTNSTDTRLLLTYDSPHQGGNVPLGFQHFLQDFGELKIAGKKFKDASEKLKQFYILNNQPATSQLLLLRASDANGTVQYNTFFTPAGSYRTMVDFTDAQRQSTPPLYEFKAISQGSQCAKWVMEPGTILSTTSGNVGTARWVAFGIVTSKYKLTVEIRALPQQGATNRISYVKMERNIRLFWGAIGTGWKTTDEKSRQSPVGLIPYDCIPGGTSSALQRSGGLNQYVTYPYHVNDWYISNFWDGVIKPFLVLISYSNVSVNLAVPFQQDIFTTVPINSSLDLQNVSLITFNQSYIFPINGTAGSTAKTYIANESFTGSVNGVAATLYNYEHADFTKRQSQWMYNEMENRDNSVINCEDAQSCSSTIFSMDGVSAFCTGTQNYSVNPGGSGLTVNWVLSNTLISPNAASIPSNSTGNVVQVTATGYGRVTLTANISVPCTNQTLSIAKTIAIGKPDLDLRFPKPPRFTPPTYIDVNVATQYTIQTNPFPGATESWTVSTDDPSFNWYYNSTTGAISFFFTQVDKTAIFYGTATNSCGTTSGAIYYRSVSGGGGGGGVPLRVITSPNPAQNQLNVSVDVNAMQQNGVTNPAWMRIKEIKVYDKLGHLKKQLQFSNGVQSTSVNVFDLPNDVYNVHVTNGVHIVIRQIIIQR